MAKLFDDDKCWPIVEKHLPYFKHIYTKIKSAKTSEQANAEIEKLYKYMKDIMPDFFEDNKMKGGYTYLAKKILECEAKLPKDFIMESNPNYMYGSTNVLVPYDAPIEDQLDWVVYMTRRYLHYKQGTSANFNRMVLNDKCKIASEKADLFANFLNLQCYKVKIYPGFCEYPELYGSNGFHYITVIVHEDKKYLLDCTYRQFFTVAHNNIERIGIVGLSGCRPGVFMTMTEERKKVAQDILRDGWIELDDDSIKNYFDGFALSYRNGLYYQVTDDYSYTTSYTARDYQNFLSGLDNQVDREGAEVLGFQRTLKPKNNN